MSGHFSVAEGTRLAELVRDHYEILSNKKKTASIDQQKDKAWEEITETLNAENQKKRTVAQVRKKWYNVKQQAKEASTKEKKSVAKTGAGKPDAPAPTTGQDIVLDMLSESRAFRGEPTYAESAVIREGDVVFNVDVALPPPPTPTPPPLAAASEAKAPAVAASSRKRQRASAGDDVVSVQELQREVLEKQSLLLDKQLHLADHFETVLWRVEGVLDRYENSYEQPQQQVGAHLPADQNVVVLENGQRYYPYHM